MEEITKIGIDVFGGMEKWEIWLHTPNNALKGLKPVELLDEPNGKNLIIKELILINHGILV